MTQRGSYAKGVAKREEILSTALEVIAREGYRGASVRELAQAVNLSQAGLLHYFGTKEELFTAVLQKRDELEWERSSGAEAALGVRETYLNVMRRYAEVPGLVELYARLAVDAVDPEHPAHDMMIARRALTRDRVAEELEKARAEGRLRRDVDPEAIARIMHAVTDGLLMQWLLEPDIDLPGIADTLFDLVSTQIADAPENAGE